MVLDSAKAPGGECWSAAVVETVQPVERMGQRVAYVVRTAVKVYVQSAMLVADGEIERVRVVDDSTKDKSGKESIEVRFANTGTSHVVARGMLEVRKPDNTTVHRIPLPNGVRTAGRQARGCGADARRCLGATTCSWRRWTTAGPTSPPRCWSTDANDPGPATRLADRDRLPCCLSLVRRTPRA